MIITSRQPIYILEQAKTRGLDLSRTPRNNIRENYKDMNLSAYKYDQPLSL